MFDLFKLYTSHSENFRFFLALLQKDFYKFLKMLDENAKSSSTSETKLILHLGLYYIVGIIGYVYFLQEFEESIVDTLYFSTAVLTTVRHV